MTGGRGVMLILGGLAATLLAIAMVSGWQGANRLQGQGEGMGEVEEAARLFVEAYGTFDFREPTAYRDRLLALSTGDVHAAVAASQVDPTALGQQQTMTTGTVSVQVTAYSDTEATVAATTEQTRRAVDATTGQLREQRLRQHVTCRLVRVEGRWLVAEFRLRSEEPLENTGR
ncbi:MAG: hypothetical protein FIB00_10605 [Chloroflexi bacterium]|nr:hypothetical protein [Chloroflexota bacterium]PWB45753.1 MAG: hypothetical protein C3F10_05515 [Dehalococcoidia bacterium]